MDLFKGANTLGHKTVHRTVFPQDNFGVHKYSDKSGIHIEEDPRTKTIRKDVQETSLAQAMEKTRSSIFLHKGSKGLDR